MHSVTDGVPGRPVFIGFGNSAIENAALTNPINLTSNVDAFAFQMPRAGVLDTLAVTFTTTQSHTIGEGEVTVYAQLFIATQNSNLYYAIPESLIALTPDLTGVVPSGTILFGSAQDMDFAVAQFSKILLVIYTVSTGTGSANNIFGVINAGLTINNQ